LFLEAFFATLRYFLSFFALQKMKKKKSSEAKRFCFFFILFRCTTIRFCVHFYAFLLFFYLFVEKKRAGTKKKRREKTQKKQRAQFLSTYALQRIMNHQIHQLHLTCGKGALKCCVQLGKRSILL
jgi:hypothetical protein